MEILKKYLLGGNPGVPGAKTGVDAEKGWAYVESQVLYRGGEVQSFSVQHSPTNVIALNHAATVE